MAANLGYILFFLCLTAISADEIDIELNKGTVMKFLRAMTNETQGADSLNLPANATSIRENITDTFSCENRTYGYYADVDNECQVFHVCLPSQTPSGRNVTYKWSFICPAETIFNQEVLVCTWPRDAIPCEDSPMYYDINMEFGRVIEDQDEKDPKKETANIAPSKIKNNKRTQNRRPVNQKQNIIAEFLNVDEKVDKELNDMGYEEVDGEEIVPVLIEDVNEGKFEGVEDKLEEVEDQSAMEEVEGRLIEERSMKWNGRKLRRGAFRFKADV